MIIIIQQLAEYVHNAGRPQVILLMGLPWLSHIFPEALGRNNDIKVNREIMELMERYIHSHLENLDQSNPKDFIDRYLLEISTTLSSTSSFYSSNGYKNLLATLTDLFQAGS